MVSYWGEKVVRKTCSFQVNVPVQWCLFSKLANYVMSKMFDAFQRLFISCMSTNVHTLCKKRFIVGSLNVIVRGAHLQFETGTCSWLCDSLFFSPNNPVDEADEYEETNTQRDTRLITLVFRLVQFY